jgi:Ca2+-binding RTX toxin-like protein
VSSAVNYALGANLENLVLTGAALNGTGNAQDNVITGNGLDNVLSGLGGNDTMIGGVGNDLYLVDVSGDLVTELAGEGTDTVSSAVNYALGANLENLVLTGSAVSGTGNGQNNVITGNALGNLLNGGAGNDRLVGGDGVDYFSGGAGNDVFAAEIAGGKVNSKNGMISLDVIMDFTAGDRIDLRGIDANANAAGNQTFSFIGSAANKSAADLSFKVYDSINGAENALGFDIDGIDGPSSVSGPVTVVFGNHDGGAPDFAIALIGVSGVTATDFIF